jgi:hypothetical protein
MDQYQAIKIPEFTFLLYCHGFNQCRANIYYFNTEILTHYFLSRLVSRHIFIRNQSLL